MCVFCEILAGRIQELSWPGSEPLRMEQESLFDLAPGTALLGLPNKSEEAKINGHLLETKKLHAEPRSIVARSSQGVNWLWRDAR